MKGLDQTWRILIILGIVFLLGNIVINLVNSLGGGAIEFRQRIVTLDNQTLLSTPLERHLNTAPENTN